MSAKMDNETFMQVVGEIECAAIAAAKRNQHAEGDRGTEVDVANAAKFNRIVRNALAGSGRDALTITEVAKAVARKACAGHSSTAPVNFED
jgi:hypothetical protein